MNKAEQVLEKLLEWLTVNVVEEDEKRRKYTDAEAITYVKGRASAYERTRGKLRQLWEEEPAEVQGEEGE